MKYFGVLVMAAWLGVVGLPFHNAVATTYDYQNPAGAGAERAGDVYGVGGRTVGYVSRDGYLTDGHGRMVGHMDEHGGLYDVRGRSVGHVSQDGRLFDARGDVIGSIDDGGRVYGPAGNSVGSIARDGTLTDVAGRVVGRVPPADRTAGMLTLLGRMPG